MRARAKLKKWGSSLGIIVPAEIVKKENLKEGEEIVFAIKKKNPLIETFGTLKDWKIDAQKMKDEARKDWAK
jgi:antitoxin component of MazEF toxin-antitoxin module